MKTLLLTLVLGLLCAQRPVTGVPKISGDWKSHSLASDNPDLIGEDGPFSQHMHHMEFDVESGYVLLSYSAKNGGECLRMSAFGKAVEDDVYQIDYYGTNRLKFVEVSDDYMLVTITNERAGNKVSQLTAIDVRGNTVDEKALEKFKELTREQNIPEENIINIFTEDCPVV
ncbi:odorant-binding protein-like [Saccopteryx bilineata]|uniref:odorant-binding protein-like n=1 Tax=Saccopteryx bilineata TaxID=59482 RepID=UPI00339046CA